MKSVVSIEIEHHPGVPTVENLQQVLDALLPTMYAVRDFKITVEKDLD